MAPRRKTGAAALQEGEAGGFNPLIAAVEGDAQLAVFELTDQTEAFIELAEADVGDIHDRYSIDVDNTKEDVAWS